MNIYGDESNFIKIYNTLGIDEALNIVLTSKKFSDLKLIHELFIKVYQANFEALSLKQIMRETFRIYYINILCDIKDEINNYHDCYYRVLTDNPYLQKIYEFEIDELFTDLIGKDGEFDFVVDETRHFLGNQLPKLKYMDEGIYWIWDNNTMLRNAIPFCSSKNDDIICGMFGKRFSENAEIYTKANIYITTIKLVKDKNRAMIICDKFYKKYQGSENYIKKEILFEFIEQLEVN